MSDIELEGASAIAVILVILIMALLLFGLVGKFVTPVNAVGNPVVLSPVRWTSYKLQKQARKETRSMVRDAQRIQRILESDTPDPVEAMLTAQDIYADYQTGSSATAAARNALTIAAETTVKATIGEIDRDEAVAAYHDAMNRIHALSTTTEPIPKHIPTPTPISTSLYHPFVISP